MDANACQAALDAVDRDEALRLTRELVDIPSPTGDERACALYLRDYCASSGVETTLQPLERGRANVIGKVPGSGDGPTIMLNGHLDTTFYGNELDDYAALGPPSSNDRATSFVHDGGIYGLGAFNMKGGVAASFLAVRALRESGAGLDGDVLASGVAGESEKAPVRGTTRGYLGRKYAGSGYGTRHLLAHCQPVDYAVVAEPSDLYVVNAQCGYLFVKVALSGKPAYLAETGSQGTTVGVNAIERAVEAVSVLKSWGRDYTADNAFDSGLGTLTPFLTVGAIEGGWPFFPSRIPGVSHLYVSLRVTPDGDPGLLVRSLRAALSQALGSDAFALEVYASNTPSTVTAPDNELCTTAVRLIEDEFGLPTRPFGRGEGDPSNDSNVFRRHGIPAIKMGPKTRTEDDAVENTRKYGVHVHVDDIVVAAKFYVRLAFELNALAAQGTR